MKQTFIAWVAEQEEADQAWASDLIANLALSARHSGDCTKEIHSCSLCILEKLLVDYREYIFGETESLADRLRKNNPYPETIFGNTDAVKESLIAKLLNENGYSSAQIFGTWGRRVWENCIKEIERFSN